MNYLLTDNGYYFTVQQPVNKALIKGTWFDSLEELQIATCERHSMDLSEIDGCEWIIKDGCFYDDRGFCYESESEKALPIEPRINNFEM